MGIKKSPKQSIELLKSEYMDIALGYHTKMEVAVQDQKDLKKKINYLKIALEKIQSEDAKVILVNKIHDLEAELKKAEEDSVTFKKQYKDYDEVVLALQNVLEK